MTQKNDHSIFLAPTNKKEIENLINNLPNKIALVLI